MFARIVLGPAVLVVLFCLLGCGTRTIISGDDDARTYGVVTGASSAHELKVRTLWLTGRVYGMQAEPDLMLGGDNFPIVAATGNTIQMSRDRSRVWIADEVRGVSMFNEPLAGGDRAPDLVLSPGADKIQSIWYEETRDIIYAASPTASFIYAWDGASTGLSRPPDRSIEIAGYLGGAHVTGATGSDRLFVAATVNTVRKVLVYDQAHLADGSQAPSRVFEPQEFSTLSPALDAQRDILYLRARAAAVIQVYTSASTREGVVTPDRTITVSFPGMTAGDWVTSLAVAPEDDLLFVGMMLGQLLVYRDISMRQGTVTPAQHERVDENLFALGVFAQ